MIWVRETQGTRQNVVAPQRGILGAGGRAVVASIDQPLTTGPISEVARLPGTIAAVARARPDIVALHRGPLVAGLWIPHAQTRLVLHLTAGSDVLAAGRRARALESRAEEAAELGAAGVSACVPVGHDRDQTRASLALLGGLTRRCDQQRVPVLALLNGHAADRDHGRELAYAAHAAGDLGVEAIRLCYTGGLAWFGQLIDACDAAVLVATVASDGRTILEVVATAVAAGAAGVMVGSRAYELNDPESLIRALNAVVHASRTAGDAYRTLVPDDRLAWRSPGAKRRSA